MKKGAEWLPAALAAVAFTAFLVAFVCQMFVYWRSVVDWANRDLKSRTDLAAAILAEPLVTQDFRRVREFGAQCAADGLRLRITGGRGGIVYDSAGSAPDSASYAQWSRCGEYSVGVLRPAAAMRRPFVGSLFVIALAALLGVAGVMLFFFVTYRQRLHIRELKRVEKFRSEFIADLSHEIKTPLTGILGAVDMLEGDSPLVPLIRRESARLNSLVQSILDLARLERGALSFAAVTAGFGDFAAIVREAAESFAPAAAAAGATVDFSEAAPADAARVSVRMIPQLVSQALGNLIGNAVRHSGSPVVSVLVECSGGEARAVVEDRGVGIPQEHAELVFERFHRVDPARSAETGGAGLGLAIVRRIAALHGGSVTLAAVKPSGCRFTFSIPAARR